MGFVPQQVCSVVQTRLVVPRGQSRENHLHYHLALVGMQVCFFPDIPILIITTHGTVDFNQVYGSSFQQPPSGLFNFYNDLGLKFWLKQSILHFWLLTLYFLSIVPILVFLIFFFNWKFSPFNSSIVSVAALQQLPSSQHIAFSLFHSLTYKKSTIWQTSAKYNQDLWSGSQFRILPLPQIFLPEKKKREKARGYLFLIRQCEPISNFL